MKKLILSLACAIMLFGCNTAPVAINPADTKLPAHVQKIEDDTNVILKKTGGRIEIVDYRDDGRILWMWTDNLATPDSKCDFVLVLGIKEKGNGDRRTYVPLFVLTDENSNDPCQEGYDLYYQNEQDKENERNAQPKHGV